MSEKLNLKHYRDLLRQGYRQLKPGCCCFNSPPNYLDAEQTFSECASGFKNFQDRGNEIIALEESAKCNHILGLFIIEAKRYRDISEIYLNLFLGDDDKQIFDPEKFSESLSKCAYAYKRGDQFGIALNLYNQTIETLIENDEKDLVCLVISKSFDEGISNFDEQLIRIEFEKLFYLLIDVYSSQKKYSQAIEKTIIYITEQKKYLNEEKDHSKISKCYLILGLLRILNEEEYLVRSVIDDMYGIYDKSCDSDIVDLKKCSKAFEEKKKEDFQYCMSYSFIMLPNNLLKALRNKFYGIEEEKEEKKVQKPKKETNSIEEAIDDEIITTIKTKKKRKSFNENSNFANKLFEGNTEIKRGRGGSFNDKDFMK